MLLLDVSPLVLLQAKHHNNPELLQSAIRLGKHARGRFPSRLVIWLQLHSKESRALLLGVKQVKVTKAVRALQSVLWLRKPLRVGTRLPSGYRQAGPIKVKMALP
jgi:late competence protein required for DNA uptake (superfamily II DNA/RNA helicase)